MSRSAALLAFLVMPAFFACGDGAPLGGAPAQAAVTQSRAAGTVATPHAGRVAVGYTIGSQDAPVAVVEFSDFGCPYCGRFALTTLPELHRDYIERGLVRWRYVPVSFGFAGGALMGAAAECAARLAGDDGFWRAHEVLYRHQTALRGADALDRMSGWLSEAGLDADRIRACIHEPATAAALEANNQVAQEWMVRGTPTFLVNGTPMSGALPTEFFRKVLDTALDPSGL